MKNSLTYLLYATLHVFSSNLNAQVTYTPDPTQFGQCPNTTEFYVLGNLPVGNKLCGDLVTATILSPNRPNASASISVLGELVVNSDDRSADLLVGLVFSDNISGNCSPNISIPVLSAANLTPELEHPNPTAILGSEITIQDIFADDSYASRGTFDPEIVTRFIFSLTGAAAGYTLTSNPASNSATVTTDLFTTGINVCVQSEVPIQCAEGSPSDPTCIEITRFVGAPIAINNAPQTLTCGNTTPITVSATPAQAGLQGYSYNWTVPSGWTVSSPSGDGSTVTITPDGINGGTISVTATVVGETSTAISTIVEIVDLDPSTQIIGPSVVCSSSTGPQESFILTPTPAAGSIVSWQVTPSYVVDGASSGNGSIASFNVSGSYAESAKIIFEVISVCDPSQEVKEFTHFFQAGYATITNINVDGNPGGSFNQVQVGGTSEYHFVAVNVYGDNDGCVDTWNASSVGNTNTYCDEIEFQFVLTSNGNSYACVVLNPYATNGCGTIGQHIIICPRSFYSSNSGVSNVIVASPNPASEYINVELLRNDGASSFESNNFSNDLDLFDQMGSLVKKGDIFNSSGYIDVSQLYPGQYYVRTIVGNEVVIEQVTIN